MAKVGHVGSLRLQQLVDDLNKGKQILLHSQMFFGKLLLALQLHDYVSFLIACELMAFSEYKPFSS